LFHPPVYERGSPDGDDAGGGGSKQHCATTHLVSSGPGFYHDHCVRFAKTADIAPASQTISYFSHGLDGKRARADPFSDPPQSRHHPVDGIVTNHPAVPAKCNQVIASDYRSLRLRQRDKHLHNAVFQHFAMPIVPHELPGCRSYFYSAKCELWFMGEDDSFQGGEQPAELDLE